MDCVIDECKDVKYGQKLWNNADHTVERLPPYLEGAVLFQLPYKKIIKGTVFTIKAPPSFHVYVAYKENRGWSDDDFSSEDGGDGKTWEWIGGEVGYKRTAKMLPRSSPILTRIWRHVIGSNSSIQLPKTTNDEFVAAIFLVEG